MQKTGLTNYCSFLVWSCLVGKRVSPMDLITMGQSTTISRFIGPFLAWWRTNIQTPNQLILEQASSWLVRRQSFAIKLSSKRYFHKTQIHWEANNIVHNMNSSHFVNVVRWARLASFSARRHGIGIKSVDRKFLQLLQEHQKVHFICERLSHLQINSHAYMFPLAYSQIV